VPKTFGENLSRLREARGLTQEGLAALIGSHGPTVSDWEEGGVDPKLSTVRKLAGALHCTVGELGGDAVTSSDRAGSDTATSRTEVPVPTLDHRSLFALLAQLSADEILDMIPDAQARVKRHRGLTRETKTEGD
jgi:transcriptional regulator with XRE-family HTH domain